MQLDDLRIVQRHLQSMAHVCNRFHEIKLLNAALDAIARCIRNEIAREDAQREIDELAGSDE